MGVGAALARIRVAGRGGRRHTRTVDQSIVITGASRGIGEAIARRLARRGNRRLVLVARTEKALRELCAELDGKAEMSFVRADLSSTASARKAAQRIRQKVGTPDVLILNAGVSNNTLFEKASLEDVTRELTVNYLAPVALIHAFLPQMIARGTGRIIAVGSLTSMVPFPGNATYAASKAALLSLMRTLAIELRPRGIRVSTVLPGLTRTQLSQDLETALPSLSPEQVADAVADVLKSGTSVLVPGLENKVAAALFRTLPRSLDKALGLLGTKIVPGYAQALTRSREE